MFPFSAGTVKISPRAANTTRLPLGEMSKDSTLSATFLKYGTRVGPVAGDGDGELAALLRGRIQVIDVARRSHRRFRPPPAGPEHVELGVMGDLGDVAGRTCRTPRGSASRSLPVADEVDLVPDPHGEIVGGGLGGDAVRRVVGQIVDPYILLAPGSIPLPMPPLPALHIERQLGPGLVVGRAGSALRGSPRALPARHSPDPPGSTSRPALPRGSDWPGRGFWSRRGSSPSIRLSYPPLGGMGPTSGIEGELPGFAPTGGDQVDLPGSCILPGEGDPSAVGAESGKDLHSLVRRKPPEPLHRPRGPYRGLRHT